MGYTLGLSLLAVLFFIGCGSPKVEHIQEDILTQEVQTPQEAPQEVQMPKLKLQDIPTTPQEETIELQ